MKHIQEDDFVIVVRPNKNEDGSWAGNLDLRIGAFIDQDTTLDIDEVADILSWVTKMAASLGVMLTNEDVYIALTEAAHEMIPEDVAEHYGEVVEKQMPTFTKDGNVITLDFWSKTEGNA